MSKVKSSKTLKWFLYSLLALIMFCMQIAPQRFGIFADVLFLFPLVVSVACLEETIPSIVFGTICGFLWDYGAQRFFGFNALMLCLICAAASFAVKFIVRPIFLSNICILAVSVLFYCIVDFFFFYVLMGYEHLGTIITAEYIPELLKTIIFGIAIAFITNKIYKISPVKAKFDMD